MAINRVTYPSTPTPASGDWDKIVDLMQTGYLKMENALRIDYVNDNVLEGAVFHIGGDVFLADSDTAITGTPSDFVKLTVSGATAAAAYVANLTGVTWNAAQNGYYDISGNLYVFDEMKAFFNGTISVVNLESGQHAIEVSDEIDSKIDTRLTAYLNETKVSFVGSDGGTATLGAWRTLALNTTNYNYISGASLSSNQIILPAGKYFINGYCAFHKTAASVCRLQNVTDATTPILGQGVWAGPAYDMSNDSMLQGYVEIAASKTFEFQYYTQATKSTDGLGRYLGGAVSNPEHRLIAIRKVTV